MSTQTTKKTDDTTPEARLLDAFAKALADMPNPKADAINPQFRKGGKGGEYVSLRALLGHAKEHLGKHGIAVTQAIISSEGRFGVETTLIGHGAKLAVGGAPMIKAPDNMSQQVFGSMVTYLKRQSLMAGLAITGDGFEVDDDGAATASAPGKPSGDSW